MTRPASSHPPPPPPPPPNHHHHQPLLIIFRGEATSYSLRLEATKHKKTEPIALIPRVVRDVPIGSSVGR